MNNWPKSFFRHEHPRAVILNIFFCQLQSCQNHWHNIRRLRLRFWGHFQSKFKTISSRSNNGDDRKVCGGNFVIFSPTLAIEWEHFPESLVKNQNQVINCLRMVGRAVSVSSCDIPVCISRNKQTQNKSIIRTRLKFVHWRENRMRKSKQCSTSRWIDKGITKDGWEGK